MKSKSFTLIELLVVIVIIGILAGVIIVSVSSSINKANFAKGQSFSNTVQNELLGDLVSEWTFDIASNPGEDTWGNNDGTVSGATYVSKADGECVYGGCMSFYGDNDYIDLGNGLNNGYTNKSFTFSVWLYNNDSGNIKAIIANRDSTSVGNIFLYKAANQKITLDLYYTQSMRWATNYSLPLDIWTNITLIFNGNRTILYTNGSLQDSTSIQAAATFPGTLIYGTFIGRDSLAEQYYWSGLIDDVRIYNRALSSSQIKQQYVAGLDSLLAKEIISKEEYNLQIESLASK